MNDSDVTAPTAAHLEKFKKLYEAGILDPEYHAKLVEGIDEVCEVAGVPRYYISHVSMNTQGCSESEIEYVMKFRSWKNSNVAGMVYYGSVASYEDHMLAMVGAFLRNYIDARVITVQSVAERLRKGLDINGTVLFIPNFFVGGNDYEWADWDKMKVYDWLCSRKYEGKQTVIGCKSYKLMNNALGETIAAFISGHFMRAGE